MHRFVLVIGFAGLFLLTGGAVPAAADVWQVKSPDHAQTFTFGSERNHGFLRQGNHLAVVLHFTNDPYVEVDNPRRYDDFIFRFPAVTVGRDGQTFYYHAPGRPPVAVAVSHPALFGENVDLLPSSSLIVDKPHGYLSLTLIISDQGSDTAER